MNRYELLGRWSSSLEACRTQDQVGFVNITLYFFFKMIDLLHKVCRERVGTSQRACPTSPQNHALGSAI